MNPSSMRRVTLRGMTSLLLAGSVLAGARVAHADPTARECATASEDALGLRKQEKLKDAKDRLLVCSAPTCPAEVRDECARRMTALIEAMPSVVFDVKDAAGNDVSAVRVSMDGALLADHLGGNSIGVDPGEHTFRFEPQGAAAVEKKVVVREGEHGRHIAVALGGADAPLAVAPTVAPPVGTTTPLYQQQQPSTSQPAAAEPSHEPSTWSGQKTAAVVVGGVGVVGVVVGSIFGAAAFSKWNDAKTACGTGCDSSSSAQSLKSDAQNAATGSTVAFAVGAAGIIGGAVLWFTAPKGAPVQVAPTVGGLTMRGTF